MIVVISGASSGIGYATAKRFLDAGHTVYGLSRSAGDLEGIHYLEADVCSEQDVQAAIASIMTQEERIDLVISNAGYGISGSFEETREEDYMRQFDVNVFGTVRLIQAVLPIMRAQMGGRILLTSSVAADIPIPFQSFYSATKSVLNSFSLSLANELRPFNIEVACLMPGDLNTGFTAAREKDLSSIYHALDHSVESMEHDEHIGNSADFAAKKLFRLGISKRKPKPLQSLGLNYSLFCILIRILPRRLTNWVVGKMYS